MPDEPDIKQENLADSDDSPLGTTDEHAGEQDTDRARRTPTPKVTATTTRRPRRSASPRPRAPRGERRRGRGRRVRGHARVRAPGQSRGRLTARARGHCSTRSTLLLMFRGAPGRLGRVNGTVSGVGHPAWIPAHPPQVRPPPGPTRSRRRRRRIRARSRPTRRRPRSDLKPVSETPTEPSDYAAISLAFGSLLAGLAASSRDREPIPRAELLTLSAATFSLSRLIVHDKAESLAARAVRGRGGRRQAPEGPAPALRGRRADDLHALHGRLERARARRAAAARAARGPHRDDRAGGLRRQRRAPGGLLVAVLAGQRAGRVGRTPASQIASSTRRAA